MPDCDLTPAAEALLRTHVFASRWDEASADLAALLEGVRAEAALGPEGEEGEGVAAAFKECDRRFRRMEVGKRLVSDWLGTTMQEFGELLLYDRRPEGVSITVPEGVPDDARVVHREYKSNCWAFLIYSKSFDPVPPGAEAPLWAPKYWKVGARQ